MVLELVSWLDDLERAVESANEGGAAASWSAGVSLVVQKGRETLERLGVIVVDPVRQPFDPELPRGDRSRSMPRRDAAPGTVVQVVHRGYRRGERALRPARVVVARAEPGGV